jgi:PX domain
MEDITEDPYEDSQRFESISIDPNQLYATSDSMALSISIESFQFIEDRMRRHVSYKIVGEDNGKKIEIYRRYKEFRLLYKILTQLWPGCLIPKLPKKKAVVGSI